MKKSPTKANNKGTPMENDGSASSEQAKIFFGLKLSEWLAILSVILVAVNIAITTSFGVHQQREQLNFQATQQARSELFEKGMQEQGENFQKEMISEQQKVQFANIVLSDYRYNPEYTLPQVLDGKFYITNNGPATAKNLRIAVCMEFVGIPWQQMYSGIDQFDISVSDASLNAAYETNTNCKSYSQKSIDTLIITIDSLPPDKTILVNIAPKQQDTYASAYTVRNISFVFQKEDYMGGGGRDGVSIVSHFDRFVLSYFQDTYFLLAQFDADANCENCLVQKDSYEYLAKVYSFIGADFSNEEILAQNDKETKVSYRLVTKEYLPADSPYLGMKTDPMFMIINEFSQGEVSQSDFDLQVSPSITPIGITPIAATWKILSYDCANSKATGALIDLTVSGGMPPYTYSPALPIYAQPGEIVRITVRSNTSDGEPSITSSFTVPSATDASVFKCDKPSGNP